MTEARIKQSAKSPGGVLGDEELIEKVVLDVLTPLKREDVDIDPVNYEITCNRIKAILREGSMALARTSGSPIVTDCGEYMLAIFDEEGNVSYVSTGVLAHSTATESAVKYIKYCFEGEINPGDQFTINEPYIVGAHVHDINIAKPIFWKNEIVAWVSSLTHTVEVGAMEPAMPARTTDIFQEGLRIPALKIVERGEASKHVLRLAERAVRDPELMTLDQVAKIAANNVVAARLDELIKKVGPDFLKQVLKKMIYETEDKSRQRVRAIPDGIWRSRVYGDFDAFNKNAFTIDITCKKENDNIFLDLSGTSPQNPGPVNSALPNSIGVIFTVFASTLFYDLVWNRGLLAPLHIHIPKGSVCNPKYPAPVNACAPTIAALLGGAVIQVVSRMCMAAGFESEVSASWNSFSSIYMGGINQHGKLQGVITMDSNAGGTGATALLDGGDTMAFLLAPGAMTADVETYEAGNPLLYLIRRQWTDSCGYGKFRGGSGGESCVMIHNTDNYRVGFRGIGKYIPPTSGIFGGYPASPQQSGFIKNAHPKTMSYQEYKNIRTIDDLQEHGVRQEMLPMFPLTPVDDGDIYYMRWPGGGGYGDPLLRKPEMVRKDISDRILSHQIADEVYGVVVNQQTNEIDYEKTSIRRENIISWRKSRWTWGKNKNVRIRHNQLEEKSLGVRGESVRIHEALEVAEEMGEYYIFCSHCGQRICSANKNYKLFVPKIERDPSDVGHTMVDHKLCVYREYFCPGCAVLLEADTVSPGDPDLWDIQIHIPLRTQRNTDK